MSRTLADATQVLAAMPPSHQQQFLASLGHWITVVGRLAYEFQGPGVTDPRLLRDLNEIHHRIYAQINSIARDGKPQFDPESMASWLLGEEKPHLQDRLAWAFDETLKRVGNGA